MSLAVAVPTAAAGLDGVQPRGPETPLGGDDAFGRYFRNHAPQGAGIVDRNLAPASSPQPAAVVPDAFERYVRSHPGGNAASPRRPQAGRRRAAGPVSFLLVVGAAAALARPVSPRPRVVRRRRVRTRLVKAGVWEGSSALGRPRSRH